jgi:hypothetical protein
MSESSWFITICCIVSGFLAAYIFIAYRSDSAIERDIEEAEEKLKKNQRRLAILDKAEAEYKKNYPVLRYAIIGLMVLNAGNVGIMLLSDHTIPLWITIPLFVAAGVLSTYSLKVQKGIENKWG